MKFIVFYLQFINSLEDLRMSFTSAASIRRFRSCIATLPLFKKGDSMVNVFSLFSLGFDRKHKWQKVANDMNCINS